MSLKTFAANTFSSWSFRAYSLAAVVVYSTRNTIRSVGRNKSGKIRREAKT